MILLRLVYRTVVLALLLLAFVVVEVTDNRKPWSSCWRHECFTQLEKDGVAE